MAAGWKYWTGASPYPEIQQEHSSAHYGPKTDRSFRIDWIQGKNDPGVELDITQWIGNKVGEAKPENSSLGEWLRDGTILCRLMNALSAGSVGGEARAKGNFGQIDNLTRFQAAAVGAGLRAEDMFAINDLLKQSKLDSVLNTLVKLKRVYDE